MNNPSFPTNFNDQKGLTAYATSVGIIFGGFGIVAILLSAVMICVFIKFCCSAPKESQEFKKRVHLIIAAGVAVVAVCGCGVGWSYNKQCNDGVQTMTLSVSALLNASDALILDLDNTVSGISTNLDAKVDATAAIQFDGVLEPIDNALVLIDNLQVKNNIFYDETQEASNNVTVIKDELTYVNEKQSDVGISGVPSGDDIPNINESFLNSITSANTSINDMRNTTLKVRSDVNATLVDVQNNLISSLKDSAADYHSNAEELTQNFNDVRTDLDNLGSDYNSTKKSINTYSEQRTQVVSAILILPIVVSLLSGLGVFLRMPRLLSVTCALSFIFFFWYILIAGVNYTLYVVTDGFCAKQSVIVGSILDSMDSPFSVPGSNNTFPVGQKIGELIQCNGSTTLIGVFEANFLIDDLKKSIARQASNVSTKANDLDFKNDFNNATKNLQDFQSNTTTLDFDQGKNLNEVHAKLENNTQQLANSNATATTQLDQDLQQVNNITTDPTRNGGYDIYYSAQNITALDCDTPWILTPSDHTDLCNYGASAKAGSAAVVLIANVTLTVHDIDQRVEGLNQSIYDSKAMQADLNVDVNNLGTSLNSSYLSANSLIAQVNSAVAAILGVVNDGVDELSNDTQCSFIGDFYIQFSDGFCKKLSPSLQVIGAMMVLGGASLFGSAILSAVSIYKIKGSSDDFEGDA